MDAIDRYGNHYKIANYSSRAHQACEAGTAKYKHGRSILNFLIRFDEHRPTCLFPLGMCATADRTTMYMYFMYVHNSIVLYM